MVKVLMAEVLSEDWVQCLVTASAERESSAAGVVELAIGKTKKARFEIVAGRVVGAVGDEVEPGVSVPVTASQLGAIVDGSESMAQAYMRGDLKPVGATGHLLALVELFEDASFRQRLVALV